MRIVGVEVGRAVAVRLGSTRTVGVAVGSTRIVLVLVGGTVVVGVRVGSTRMVNVRVGSMRTVNVRVGVKVGVGSMRRVLVDVGSGRRVAVGVGLRTVIQLEPVLYRLERLVAVALTEYPGGESGAVYFPMSSIVPTVALPPTTPFTDHRTAVVGTP
jgi:hypothetical protein